MGDNAVLIAVDHLGLLWSDGYRRRRPGEDSAVRSGEDRAIFRTGHCQSDSCCGRSAVYVGELLIELVNTKTQTDLTRLSGERRAYAREKSRITDQLTALDTFQSPNAYFDNISLGSARKPSFGTVFSARTASSLNDHFASIAAIDEEINQNRAERSTNERQIELLDATIPLISERAESLKQPEQRSLHA